MRKTILVISIFVLASFGLFKLLKQNSSQQISNQLTDTDNLQDNSLIQNSEFPSLAIENLRKVNFTGSEIIIEQTLSSGSNYKRYIASYKSEGLNIYTLLTIPNSDAPTGGWPVVVFNHGYIPPAEYRTTERYIAYVDGFARNGYIVIKPDYRGHGSSEGVAVGAYGSNAYTIDVSNAVASIKRFKDVNPEKIGMWGHSLGGFITLRNMVARKDIKAGVIWAGVVGSYADMLNNWRRGNQPTFPLPSGSRRWRQTLIEQYGAPEQNPTFWNSISANSYLADISGPLQLHHGTADTSVPLEFSQKLNDELKKAGKEVEIYTYPGNDHNISQSFNLAMQRSIEFFDKYLKN